MHKYIIFVYVMISVNVLRVCINLYATLIHQNPSFIIIIIMKLDFIYDKKKHLLIKILFDFFSGREQIRIK